MDGDELAPLLVAPPSYFALRRKIRSALCSPTERRALVIGIDEVDGSGKSSATSLAKLALKMPAVHLDLYFVREASRSPADTTSFRVFWTGRLCCYDH
jgi:hypothetical protein